MKYLFFGSVALLALAVAGPVGAADMPAKAPVYKAAPLVALYNWTGCYVGGGGGRGMWKQDFHQETPPTASTATGGNGWFGTVQGGCDYQFDRWVIGAFGDYDFGNIKGNIVIPAAAAVGEE